MHRAGKNNIHIYDAAPAVEFTMIFFEKSIERFFELYGEKAAAHLLIIEIYIKVFRTFPRN